MTDDSGVSISTTFWGKLSHDEEICVGCVVALKNAKVSEFGGKSLNVDSNSCSLVINPDSEKRYQELMKWY